MEDFFKNLRDDSPQQIAQPHLNLENVSNNPSINSDDKPKESENVVYAQNKEEDIYRTIQKLEPNDIVDVDELSMKLSELSEEKRIHGVAMDESRTQSTPNNDEGNKVIVTGKDVDAISALIGNSEPNTTQPVTVQEVTGSDLTKSDVEDLKNQSTNIIDSAKTQTQKVIDNAIVNFNVNVLTKANELEEYAKEHRLSSPSSEEAAMEEAVDASSTGNMMNFLN